MTVVVPDCEAEQEAAARASYALVEQHRAGDQTAFETIYRKHHAVVLSFVYSRTGNRRLAEDLAQETFLRAFRRISKFEWQGKHVAGWLVTIARNLVADHFKSASYSREVFIEDGLGADRVDLTPEGNPEGTAVGHLTNLVLLDGLKQLSADQRECLVLRYLRGLSVAETAAVMGREVGAVKALQYRAVRSLARLVGDELWTGPGPRPALSRSWIR